MSLEDAFHAPRIDASGVRLRINRKARPDVAASVGRKFDVEIVDDTLYPVNFAIPSAVCRDGEENVGMAHHNHPWAAVGMEAAS